MDRGAWWAVVHGVAMSRTRLSNFTFTSHFHVLEKEMATQFSVLAWRIQGWGSLVGCRLWGPTESDTTEATLQQQQQTPYWRADITLWTKVHLVKTMVFPVVMYGCESWTIKKAEHRRIDAFELWCWKRLLRVHWTARRSNQSILKEISPGYSLEGLTLKLKLQYFGHLMRRADSLEKTLMLAKIGGRRRRGRQRMR